MAAHHGGLSCGARVSGVRTLVVVVRRLQSTSSAIVVPGLSCPAACGISLDQGSNPRLLHRQADSSPLSHQGSPAGTLLTCTLCLGRGCLGFLCSGHPAHHPPPPPRRFRPCIHSAPASHHRIYWDTCRVCVFVEAALKPIDTPPHTLKTPENPGI